MCLFGKVTNYCIQLTRDIREPERPEFIAYDYPN